ncbi:MAG: PIN domain-containing protein [Ktedonobacterales bacterium]
MPVDAVLDANILLPAPLRDTLLRAADEGLYRPRWSEDILLEVRRNLISVWKLSDTQARRAVETMNEAFPEAKVEEYEALIDRMPNHPKDRHVLAAAVTCGAEIIVTQNLRDFPQRLLTPLNVVAMSADDFLLRLCASSTDIFIRIIAEQAAELRHPPKTAPDIVTMLAKHAPAFAELMRSEIGEIGK